MVSKVESTTRPQGDYVYMPSLGYWVKWDTLVRANSFDEPQDRGTEAVPAYSPREHDPVSDAQEHAERSAATMTDKVTFRHLQDDLPDRFSPSNRMYDPEQFYSPGYAPYGLYNSDFFYPMEGVPEHYPVNTGPRPNYGPPPSGFPLDVQLEGGEGTDQLAGGDRPDGQYQYYVNGSYMTPDEMDATYGLQEGADLRAYFDKHGSGTGVYNPTPRSYALDKFPVPADMQGGRLLTGSDALLRSMGVPDSGGDMGGNELPPEPVPMSENIQGQQGTDTLVGSARGIRNNNPGNIEYGAFARSMGATRSDGRFAVFPSPDQGIAAIYALQNKYESGGQTTVAQRIAKWAPSSENRTGAYAQAVANRMGIPVDQPFNIRDPMLGPAFVDAMIEVENGSNPYPGESVQKAQSVALGAPQPGMSSSVVPQKLARFVQNEVSGAPAPETVAKPRLSPTSMAKYLAPTGPTPVEAVSDDNPQQINRAAKGDREVTAPAPGAEPIAGTDPESEGTLLDIGGPTPTPLRVKVQKGDTLWDIAKDHLGEGQRWTEIAEANSIPKGAEKRLQIGTVLDVPGALGPPNPPMRPEAAPPEVPLPTESAMAFAPQGERLPSFEPDTSRLPPPVAGTQTGDRTMDQWSTVLPPVPPTETATPPPPPVTAPEPTRSAQPPAVITEQQPPLATPEQMQTSYDTRSDQRLQTAIDQVPSVADRVRELFKDSAFTLGLLPETKKIAGRITVVPPEPDDLDLTGPLETTTRPQPPVAPTKTQDRVVPSGLPAEQTANPDPYVPSIVQKSTQVAAPRDTVSGAQPAARTASDFRPLTPDAFRQRPPLNAQNPTYGTASNGAPYVAYDQNGYHVVANSNGSALRTTIGNSSQSEYFSPQTQTWQSSATGTAAPAAWATPTPTPRPSTGATQPSQTSGQTSGQTSPSAAYQTGTTKPATPSPYATKPTQYTSGTGFVGGGGTLANI